MWINFDDLMLNTEKLCGIMQDDENILLYSTPNENPYMFNFESSEKAEIAYYKILQGIKDGANLVQLDR